MARLTQFSEKQVAGLGVLDEEHSEIHRKYLELSRTILEGSSLQRMRAVSEILTELILLHLVHEEEFLRKMLFPLLAEHRDAQMGMMAEIFKIELDLSRNDVSAPLRLRDLCGDWMREHIHIETQELQIAVMSSADQQGF